MRKVKLAFKSAVVVVLKTFDILNAVESRGRGGEFGLNLSSGINSRLTEELVGLGLKRNDTEFFKSELAEVTEAA